MVAATAMWGGHYVLGEVAVKTMSPMDLTYLRWAIAVLPLVLIAQFVEKPDWRAVLRAWPRLLLLAILGMIAYNLFLYAALTFTTAIGASLVNAANPAVMAVLAVFLCRERLRGRAMVGIAVSLLGVLVVLTHGSLDALITLDFNEGQLLMIGAIVVWSLYSIWGRMPSVPPISSTAAQAVIVLIVMTPFALVNGVEIPQNPEPIMALLYIGLFPSVGSYVLWNIAGRTTAPGTAGIFLNLITVFTVAISVAFGQALTATDVVGGAVVVIGVLLTSTPSGSIGRLRARSSGREKMRPESQELEDVRSS